MAYCSGDHHQIKEYDQNQRNRHGLRNRPVRILYFAYHKCNGYYGAIRYHSVRYCLNPAKGSHTAFKKVGEISPVKVRVCKCNHTVNYHRDNQQRHKQVVKLTCSRNLQQVQHRYKHDRDKCQRNLKRSQSRKAYTKICSHIDCRKCNRDAIRNQVTPCGDKPPFLIHRLCREYKHAARLWISDGKLCNHDPI